MSGGILNCGSVYGTLTVNGLLLCDDWVCCHDLSPLWDDFEIRGADTLVPHLMGEIGHRRRRTVTRKDFAFVLSGWVKYDGTPTSDRAMTLIENAEYLRAQIGIANNTGAGTVTARWERPDGSAKEAQVHVLSPLRLATPIKQVQRGVLSLSFLTGAWVTAAGGGGGGGDAMSFPSDDLFPSADLFPAEP